MSQRRERSEGFDLRTALGDFEEWYHIPLLVVLLGFMLWVRVQSYSNFVREGRVLLSGNDAWYHLRQTTYTVRNWPQTMPFDPWTYFPFGTASSQFGSLFDQIIATIALIVGLGDPSQNTIAMVTLLMPAVFGTLVAIPVYLAGKRLGGRFGGLVSVLVLALSTGEFLQRSLVGFADHQVGEVLFQMIAVLGIMVAVSVAESERPVWELVANREWDALRRPLAWSMLAGVALALYVWVWPPAVLLVVILGIFFLLQLSADYLRGRSPDHVAFAGVVALATAGLLSFVPLNTLGISPTSFSLLQPLMMLGVAFGCAFMAWLARQWDQRDLDRRGYPVVVLAIIGAIAGVMALATPGLFEFFVQNAQRIFGAGGARAGTVGEAQPLSQPIATFFSNYGLTFVTAAVGVVAIVAAQFREESARAEQLFVVVWGVVLLFATLSQQRFDYYLALAVVVLNAYVVRLVVDYLTGSGAVRKLDDIETFQVLTIAAVLLVILAPLVVRPGMATALDRGERNGPSPGTSGWDSSLDWLQNNTPAEGTYGGADNRMDYFGQYQRQSDFDYPAGSYGVMSWWDYGHWITVRGERIPNANPFQQGAVSAANFLLAPNQTAADQVMESVSEDDAKTRYVMVDWKMTNVWSNYGGKFFAPIVFNDDVSQQEFYQRVISLEGDRPRVSYYTRSQRYYESMVNRLWHFHGSAQRPNPLVVNYDERSANGQTARIAPSGGEPRYRWFRSLQAARQFVNEDGSAQIGGIGPNPPEYVSALEHYRLVRNSETPALSQRSAYTATRQRGQIGLAGGSGAVQGMSSQQRARISRDLQRAFFPDGGGTPWVKVFERVPGATIEGTGPANANVTASVRMRSPTTNSTFFYRQIVQTGPEGNFEVTVPYSTTGYDRFGPSNGYTNVSVRAVGPYQIYESQSATNYLPTARANTSTGEQFIYRTTANVTEAQVVGEDTGPVSVELDKRVVREPTQDTDTQSGSENGSTNATISPDETADGTTDDTSSGDTSTNQTTTESGGNASGQSAVAAPRQLVSP